MRRVFYLFTLALGGALTASVVFQVIRAASALETRALDAAESASLRAATYEGRPFGDAPFVQALGGVMALSPPGETATRLLQFQLSKHGTDTRYGTA